MRTLFLVGILSVFLMAAPCSRAGALMAEFAATGFRLELPEGWQVRERVKVWTPPADAARTLELLAAPEFESGRVTGAYIKVPSPDSFCTLEIVTASPMPPFDAAGAERLGMKWGDGMRRVIRGFTLLDSGFFQAGEYSAVKIVGRWDSGGKRYETSQYMFSDVAASYKLVFLYPALEAEKWRAEADSIVKGVKAGPAVEPSSALKRYSRVLGAAALLFVLLWLVFRFRRKSAVAPALLLAFCSLSPALPARAETPPPGSALSVEIPPGYEAFTAEEMRDMLRHDYAGYFDPALQPWVLFITPSEEEEDLPGSDWFFWGYYPVEAGGARRSAEDFRRRFLAFNRYEDVKDVSLEEKEVAGRKVFEYLFKLKVPSSDELYNLALGVPIPFGYMVFEARESEKRLFAARDDFLKSLLSLKFLRPLPSADEKGPARLPAWILLLVLGGAVFAALLVVFLKSRARPSGE